MSEPPGSVTETQYKSPHARLEAEGFGIERFIEDAHLATGLSLLMLDMAAGRFAQLRILPSSVAFEGERYSLEKPHHIAYCIPSHPLVSRDDDVRMPRTDAIMCAPHEGLGPPETKNFYLVEHADDAPRGR